MVVASCLVGTPGQRPAAKLRLALGAAVDIPGVSVGNYHELLDALCKAQPRVVLDTLFAGSGEEIRASRRLMKWFSEHQRSPLDRISE